MSAVPAYDPALSAKVAALIPVFACTPDQLPDMMATALRRGDIAAWTAACGIKLVRATEVSKYLRAERFHLDRANAPG